MKHNKITHSFVLSHDNNCVKFTAGKLTARFARYIFYHEELFRSNPSLNTVALTFSSMYIKSVLKKIN